MAFKPQEVAEITVQGKRYRDWESVTVIMEEGASNNTFRLTVSEGAPLSKDWGSIKIRPGDPCTIKLAGELAISGYVETRKVAYTAEQHGIEIIGVSQNKAAADGAAQTKTMEFRNKPLVPIAQEVLKPAGVKVVPKGKIPEKPFPRASIPPGQSRFNFIEQLARMRGVILGTDVDGNMTMRTQYDSGGGDALVEGKNILEGSEVMTMSQGGGADQGIGQDYSSNEKHGPAAAQAGNAESSNGVLKRLGSKGVHAPNLQNAERPVDKDDAQTRTKTESGKRGEEQLQVTIVVQGWLKPGGGGLWMPGKKVKVKSPMLIIDEELNIKKVTFTQDNKSGTRTSLDLSRESGGEQDQGTKQDYTSPNKPAPVAETGPPGSRPPSLGE